jgi:hypothetical protein
MGYLPRRLVTIAAAVYFLRGITPEVRRPYEPFDLSILGGETTTVNEVQQQAIRFCL